MLKAKIKMYPPGFMLLDNVNGLFALHVVRFKLSLRLTSLCKVSLLILVKHLSAPGLQYTLREIYPP